MSGESFSVHILALGSLRCGSHNRQLAETAVKRIPEGVEVTLCGGLVEVPFYNEDIDTTKQRPDAAIRLSEAATRADAFLLVTPMYTGTMPDRLRYAIDWLSRPFRSSVLAGSPTAVVSTTFGQYGGVWAQDDARKSASIASIASATIVEDVKLAMAVSVPRFAETHPADALLHDRVTSELACPVGWLGRMPLCRRRIRKSSARTASGSRGTAARA
ncbi:NAD(P)H-dependent oxidoreductase [Streptomyces sp. NBC_01003]|uniref:NAD(P)H-dependent oxidoreductase n=1 Tax=Streptomyces sp. NBC_01003 TaxID=2903714 RepID=UPI003870677F|nr:NAD(P)H-dependent oxidoreductase [Streptomyces sp. NBC_01003]